jgi:hypothetical protein
MKVDLITGLYFELPTRRVSGAASYQPARRNVAEERWRQKYVKEELKHALLVVVLNST